MKQKQSSQQPTNAWYRRGNTTYNAGIVNPGEDFSILELGDINGFGLESSICHGTLLWALVQDDLYVFLRASHGIMKSIAGLVVYSICLYTEVI